MSIDWIHFTPLASLAGGAMIGLAAGVLLLATGRIAGISGILGGTLGAPRNEVGWRLAFVAGLVAAPWCARALVGPIHPHVDAAVPVLVLGGLLVGFGTRLGNGCTSGHGVCGLANRSLRSLVAVSIFMATGCATVFVVRHGIPWAR